MQRHSTATLEKNQSNSGLDSEKIRPWRLLSEKPDKSGINVPFLFIMYCHVTLFHLEGPLVVDPKGVDGAVVVLATTAPTLSPSTNITQQ
jgi:hypothetical protein